jgi:hypothetical protein
MKFVWNELPRPLRKRIVERASKWIPSCRPYELARFIDGLKGMQYDWRNEGERDDEGRTRERILEKVVFDGIIINYHEKYAKTDFYDARQLANCIYFLSGIAKQRKQQLLNNFSLSEKDRRMILTEEVYDSFWNGILKSSSYFETRGIAIMMEG